LILDLKSRTQELNLASKRRIEPDDDFELRQTKRQRIAEWLEQRSKTPNQDILSIQEISSNQEISVNQIFSNEVKIKPQFVESNKSDFEKSGKFFIFILTLVINS
jgi:hypothetical protein